MKTAVRTALTTCVRDCPDACRIVATVEGDRVTSLRGDPGHPITQGFLCHRTATFLERQYSDRRILSPMVRDGAGWRAIGWDEALDLAVARMVRFRAESGPASIFHYLSGGSLGVVQSVVQAFWQAFGPVTVKRGDICSGAGDEAQLIDFGCEDSNDVFDLLHSRHILLWGKNPAVSSPHLVPILRRARDRGATLTLIDPVFHKTAHLCDTVVQPRPAGDFDLAMAVARALLDGGGICADAGASCENLDRFAALAHTHTVAEWCARAEVPLAAALQIAQRLSDGPAAILVGWGMGRRGNGGAIVRALDALGAVSGNLRRPGGGVSFYYKRKGAFDTSFASASLPPRTICEPLFGHEVEAARDPPVRMVWITAGNPVAMLPDARRVQAALQSREFVVVVDSFWTDTARAADLVLPAATLLEVDDVVGAYGHHWIGVADAVVPPLGASKTDLQIVQALAARVGLAEVVAGTAEEWRTRVAAPALAAIGGGLDVLRKGYVRNPLAARVLFAERPIATQSGRVRLISEAPVDRPPDTAWPLYLLSLSTERSQSSQWARPPEGPAIVTVHPSAAPDLRDGDIAVVRSRIGALRVRLRFDRRQRPDVAIVAKGGDLHGGRCANALVRARLTDIGEGGALYDEGVRIEPIGAAAESGGSASLA